MDRMWFTLQKHLLKSNSLQIVLVSVIVHSLISILLIYVHLGWYFDYEISKFEPYGLADKEGGVVFARRRHQLNLISSELLDANQVSQGYRGWWMDHAKWNVHVECFPSKWMLCTKIFSSQCRPEGVRSIYQYIPIRRDSLLQNIEISLRAHAENLEEQGQDSAFGLHALVLLSNGHAETLKIEFPSELEDWAKRYVRYTSPPGTQITELTVMLTCVGYLGAVSFTEVEVVSLPEASSLDAAAIVAECERDSHPTPKQSNAEYIPEFMDLQAKGLAANSRPVELNSVTLVTQVSMDRLSVLEKTLQTWTGPISLAVYVAVKDVREGLVEWQRLYTEKKIRSLKLQAGSHVTLVIGSDKQTDYPINILRNFALKKVETKYMLVIDADFQPSPDFEKRFMAIVSTANTSKAAFVVPAFEYNDAPEKGDEIPKSKEEFLQLMFREEPMIQPFRVFESGEAHRLTDYWKWYFASATYPVHGFSDKYEPYVVVETRGVPDFDEMFTGYGMNKVTHTTELFAAGYKFLVLHNAWLIHLPHKSTSFSQDFLQSPSVRLQNRARRFQFMKKIIGKYGLKQKECPA